MNEIRPVEQGVGKLETLAQIERKLVWLASWMIHHANHIRPNPEGQKVGGHQASCASVATIMTALYFDALRPQDRVAVKPHAGPVLHAINYLFGRQSLEKLQALRQFGGAQAYPSRVKDGPEIDFSTGSVGLGVALTSFSSLIQDYVQAHGLAKAGLPRARNVAIAGDAELDEGNIYEALLEGWKHDVRDVWWVVDYNRQSLDSVMPDRLFGRFEGLFRDMGWKVATLKYGRKLEAAFSSLEELSVFARQREVEILLENIPNGLSSAERLADFVESTHLTLGFCLDVGHAHLGEGVQAAFHRMQPRLRSTHLHDNDGREDSHLFPLIRPQGTIDWEKTMRLLRACGDQLPLLLELREDPELKNPLEAVGEVFDRLEKL